MTAMPCKCLWIFCLTTVLNLSCKKENTTPSADDNNPVDEKVKTVIAGRSDSTDFYFLLSPPELVEVRETGCLFFSGTDSLDIDGDGKPDLAFHSRTQNPDLTGECCDCPDDPEIFCDCWPTGRIYKFVEVLDTLCNVACDTEKRAWRFELNDTIKASIGWTGSSPVTLIDFYNFPPPETIYGNFDSSENQYLGIRKTGSDTLYGWVRLDLSETIEIDEMYFEKNMNFSY